MSKTVLGRGLDALLGAEHGSASFPIDFLMPAGLQRDVVGGLTCDIAMLRPNPHQPRHEFSDESLQELAASIKEHGVIQPITIEDSGDGNFFIIAGERRTRAAKLAGLSHVPVILKSYTDIKRLEIALIENIQREDLNPVDEAAAYQKLMELGNLSQEDLAQRVGKKRSTVANALRLLKLPPKMLNALKSGKITSGHGRALLAIADETERETLFAQMLSGGMTVRMAEAASAGDMSENKAGDVFDFDAASFDTESKSSLAVGVALKNPSTAGAVDGDFLKLEQSLIEKFGTKVALKGSFERGAIQIDFYSKTDLERILEIIQ
ncbi:MAG: ParB/RepB/Spo0J family partition protein [Treponemataceae bacterium]|nr:MAG: ParB/RepB/Spo0J family partition protein [Treponemataceae bacterium]